MEMISMLKIQPFDYYYYIAKMKEEESVGLGDRSVFLYQPDVPQFNSTLTLSMESIKSHILRAQSYRTAAPPNSDVSHKPMF